MDKIIFLADSWGYTKGGINSFNIDLCKSIAEIISSNIEPVCIVPFAEEQQINDALKSGVTLLSLHQDKNVQSFNGSDMANAYLKLKEDTHQILWIIGHDVITGHQAFELKEIISSHSKYDTKICIIHHMDYESYSIFKALTNKDPMILSKMKNQQDILSHADRVLGVGPYLKESAEDIIDKDVIMLIPGLKESEANEQILNKFKVIAFGRIDAENDIIKQASLIVKAFGKAIAKEPRMKESVLTMIGIEDGSESIKELLNLGREYAKRQITINGIPYVSDRDTLKSTLRRHSLCIMPSLREGFGLVGWEAIDETVPIIISDSSGLYKFLRNFGGVVEGCFQKIDIKHTDEDIDELSKLIIAVFNNQEKHKQDAISLKKTLVEKGYSWTKAAIDFVEALQLPSNPLKSKQGPFKYLNSYTEGDKEFFFGREVEAQEFIDLIKGDSPYLLFFGKSGVGKTSFINAKIIPILKTNSYKTKSIRLGIDLNVLKGELDNLQKENQHVNTVIFIDQFEELFVNYNASIRVEFVSILRKHASLTYIKIVLVFREDFLAEMHDLEKSLPSLLKNRYRLNNLSMDEAAMAIRKPFELTNSHISDILVETIINELKLDDNRIFPPQLQIVTYTIHKNYKYKKEEIGIDDYNKIGRMKGILGEYVDLSLETSDYQERFIIKEVLKSFVSSIGTKIPKKSSELKNIIQTRFPDFNIDEFERVINSLIHARLIIRYEFSETLSYELTHEYLIEKIKNWIDRDSYKIKEIEEIIEKEQKYWSSQHKLMEFSKFEYICQFKAQLLLDKFQKILMLRTSIEYNYDIEFWIKDNIQNEIAKNIIKQDLHTDINKDVKCRIVPILLLFNLTDEEKDDAFVEISTIGYKSILLNYQKWSCLLDLYDIQIEVRIRKCIESKLLNRMAYVEEGEFLMGRNQNELSLLKERLGEHFFSDETLLQNVYVGSFLIDKYLVSNDDLKELFPDTTYHSDYANHPATSISVEKACKYAKYYDKEIPNEIIWEKAARGIDGRLFPWGNEWDTNKCSTRLSGIAGTTPVGQYPSGVSPYGCYDMAGNVWEWTITPKSEGIYIVKGGSWTQMNILPWCSYKFNYNEDGQQNVGFRCIRKIENDLENSDKVYSSGGVVFRMDNNEIYILLCGKKDTGEWRLPKGMLEHGEQVRACAVREVFEETGYTANIKEFIDFVSWSYIYENRVWDETAFFYLMETDSSLPEKHDIEFDIVEWILIKEALEKVTYNEEKCILEKARVLIIDK